VRLGKALIGSSVAQSADDVRRCAQGDSTACVAVGRAVAGSGIARGVADADKCVGGDAAACLAVGRAMTSLVGGAG
jgi:hypothetical protein